MQILIDIPQGLKIDFENENWTALTCMEMKNALMKGTPLPKGHGKLITEPTEEEIAETIGGKNDFADCIREAVKTVFANATPIIEADKEYEVEVITRGNCMMCGKELTEGLFFCKECENKANSGK